MYHEVWSIFVSPNKALMEHSHTYLFKYCLLSTTIYPAKPKIFTIWPLTEKFADIYFKWLLHVATLGLRLQE